MDPISSDPNSAKQAANVIRRDAPRFCATTLIFQPMMAQPCFRPARAKHAREADYPYKIHEQECLEAWLDFLRSGRSWTHVWHMSCLV